MGRTRGHRSIFDVLSFQQLELERQRLGKSNKKRGITARSLPHQVIYRLGVRPACEVSSVRVFVSQAVCRCLSVRDLSAFGIWSSQFGHRPLSPANEQEEKRNNQRGARDPNHKGNELRIITFLVRQQDEARPLLRTVEAIRIDYDRCLESVENLQEFACVANRLNDYVVAVRTLAQEYDTGTRKPRNISKEATPNEPQAEPGSNVGDLFHRIPIRGRGRQPTLVRFECKGPSFEMQKHKKSDRTAVPTFGEMCRRGWLVGNRLKSEQSTDDIEVDHAPPRFRKNKAAINAVTPRPRATI